MHRNVCLLLLLFLGNFALGFASETNEMKAGTNWVAPTSSVALSNTIATATAKTDGGTNSEAAPKDPLQANLELVRTLRFQKSFLLAQKQAEDLLGEKTPIEIRRMALLELAYIAQDAGELAKSQAIFGDYMRRYAKDPSVPEVCLRQGLLYRQMGAHSQALMKFYQVMNLALSLKLNELEYYQSLVLKAKTEIAETYYVQGNYKDAADYFSRLLKAEEKGLDRTTCHFKLVRSLAAQQDHTNVIAQGQSFLQLYPDSLDVPEVRFMLADSLKKIGRNRESMQQVLLLLQSQQKQAEAHPEIWAYWQQKTGNEIANELYKEGDYMSALEIYLGLTKVNSASSWQAPVLYQIGLVYEHLKQPAKAREAYDSILKRQEDIRANSPTPGLLALLDMAQWRREYLKWGDGTDQALKKLSVPTGEKKAESAALN
jgi:tetratricopeptide (TPR) repeat protein